MVSTKKGKLLSVLIIIAMLLQLYILPMASANDEDASANAGPQGFPLASQSGAADIYVDTLIDSKNYVGIAHAAENLQGDIEAVTGIRPLLKTSAT